MNEIYTASQSHRLCDTHLAAEVQKVNFNLEGHLGISGTLFSKHNTKITDSKGCTSIMSFVHLPLCTL